MSHAITYLSETAKIIEALNPVEIDALADELSLIRSNGGRVFCLGLGGGAANASHAASDFRRLCGINAFAPTDCMAEFTARANDDGWNQSFAGYLAMNDAKARDAIFVFSVGGGNGPVSSNIVVAINEARKRDMTVLGIVGRDGGQTKAHGHVVIVVPTVNAERVTPHTEGWQMVIFHCLMCNPKLMRSPTKW